jgi:hypothetical protein
MNFKAIPLALLTLALYSGEAPNSQLNIFSPHIVSPEGKHRLQQGTWFGLLDSPNGSELVKGPPRFRPAGEKSPNETAIEVLPPKGMKGHIRFWLQGKGLRPGKLLTGSIAKVNGRFPTKMVGRFANESLTISASKQKDGSYSLSVSQRGKTYALINEENADPDNNGWQLVWIGDLNSDGTVDLVLELSRYMTLETVVLLGQPGGGFQVAARDEEDWD